MFDTLSDKFQSALKTIQGQHKISESNIEETLKEVKTALLEADVNFKVVKNFIQTVKEQSLGEKVIKGVNPGEQFVKIVNDELTKLMGGEVRELDLASSKPPKVILVVGLNGAGKTTFCAKLALFLRQKYKKNAYLVPADNFRPAAKDQLLTLAKGINVPYFDSDLSMHPRDICKHGISAAQSADCDVVILDTAGRLHVDNELMGQIREVGDSLKHLNPEVLLVADAMTGQESVTVAQSFAEAVPLTGAVLSKMDSDARGGAALSIRAMTGVPIMFFSHGEKMVDLDLFYPDRMASRILDMGDVLTLVEKAQDVIDEKEATDIMKKMEKNKFTIDDFVRQMDMISKMGPLTSLMKMIPGMGGMMKQLGDMGDMQGELNRTKVMISSMTKKERDDHTLFNKEKTRVARVAKGSGVPVVEVQKFITKFEQMRGMMSSMMKMMGGMGGMMGGAGGGSMPSNPMDMLSQMGGAGGMGGMGKKKSSKGKGQQWGNRYFKK